MDLLEYQAKQLFSEIGIPVLPSQRIDQPRDLKGLRIPYPVVLKSQVRAGGRGRAGGIRFVENTIDAIAAARTIFNLPILGEYPQVLLAEARYNADREFYLAVVLDYAQRRPVLLGSPQGGIDVDALMEKMQVVVVDRQFSPFYARRLALQMGLRGSLIQSVSAIIEKMFQLFIEKDLDLVEINPLGVSAAGELMALDGKISANDNALNRHADLVALTSNQVNSKTHKLYPAIGLSSLNPVEKEGNIGILCNGTGLAMATLDVVYQAKGRPVRCLAISDQIHSYRPEKLSEEEVGARFGELLQQGLEQLIQMKGIKVILVNLLISGARSEAIAEVLANLPTIVEKSPSSRLQYVIRLAGAVNKVQEPIAALPIHWADTLDDAVSLSISLTKSTKK